MDARPLSITGIGVLMVAAVALLARDGAPPPAPAIQQVVAAPAAPAESGPRPYRTAADLLAEFIGESADSDGGGAAAIPYDVRTSIVILPDPVDSRLDWAYDAGIESVRRAHERAGYVVDRFWLPWRGTHPDSAGGAAGGSTPPLRATRPGVLLFRSRDATVPRSAAERGNLRQLSVVYVVGETPTTGVSKIALAAALAERGALGAVPGTRRAPAADDTVRIVGPVFSGSIPSLRLTLEGWSRQATGAALPPVLVRTGAATNTSNAALLTDATGPGLRIVYATTVHPFGNLEAAMVETIERRLGVPRRRIALLVESTTQFGRFAGDSYERDGASSGGAAGEPLRVPFPINISSVRNGYSRDPRTIAALDSAARAGGSRVPLPLAGSPWVTDNPVVLSRLTPAIVEMAITDMVHILAEQDIAAVGVIATDIQDRIFVLSEIKQRLRDVQLFTFGSNVLLTRPDVTTALRGTLVFSTYPLVAGNELWLTGAREPLVFGSDIAEGVYNASALAIGAPEAAIDYDLPVGTTGTQRAPAVWVSTVGEGAMYPVSAHAPDALRSDAPDATLPVARLAPTSRVGGMDEEQGLAAYATLALMLMACVLAITLLHGRQARCPPEHPDDLAEGIDAPPAERGRSMERAHLVVQSELYAALGAAALAGLLLIVLLLIVHARLGGVRVPWIFWFLTLGLVLGIVLAVRMLVKAMNLARTLNRGWSAQRGFGSMWPLYREEAMAALLVCGGVAYVFLLGDVLWHIAVAAEAVSGPLHAGTLDATIARLNAESLVRRAVAIRSGVSPLAPVLVIGAGLAAYAGWHIRRLNLLGDAPAFEQVLLTRWPGSGRDPDAAFGRAAGAMPDAAPDATAATGMPDPAAAGIRRERVPHDSAGLSTAAAVGPSTAGGERDGVGRIPEPAGRGTAFYEVPDGPLRDLAPSARRAASPAAARVPLFARALHAVPEDWWPRRSLADRVLRPPPPVATLATVGLACEVRRIRSVLARLLPGRAFQVLFFILALGACVLLAEFSRTLETVAFADQPSTMVSRAVAAFGAAGAIAGAGAGALTSFDLLLRAGILAGLGATIWSLARFLAVWGALRAALDRIGGTPLHATFRTLPPAVARLTRLSPFDLPSQAILHRVTQQEWLELRRWSAARGVMLGERPPRLESPYGARLSDGRELEALVGSLEAQWAADEVAQLTPTGAANGDDGGAPAAGPPHPWTVAASRCVAIYVVEYVEWVFGNLRTLAVFLLTSLLLLTALLASYPFQPQGTLRGIFAIVLVATVASIVMVLLQMDRHDVLSEIGQTDPGRVTVSWPLLRNILTFAVIPVLAFLSTEIPTLQQILFVWLAPLMRAFGG